MTEKKYITQVEHHMDELETEIAVLRQQTRAQQQQERDEEYKGDEFRIHELAKKITTDFKHVARARGGGEEEIELLAEQQPHIFDVMTKPNSSRRLRSRGNRNSKD